MAKDHSIQEKARVLWQKVQNHTKWNDDKVGLWFGTPNPLLGNISPTQMFAMGRAEKLEKFIDALIAESLP